MMKNGLSLFLPVPEKISILKSNLKITRMNTASSQLERYMKGFNIKSRALVSVPGRESCDLSKSSQH
jgi:hypothetical protein